MKARHKAALAFDARETLHMLNVTPGQDFHTLSSAQVELLLAEADRVRYQRPANANGSRARYFFERLQRHAQRS